MMNPNKGFSTIVDQNTRLVKNVILGDDFP